MKTAVFLTLTFTIANSSFAQTPPKTANGPCTEAVIKNLAAQFGAEDIQSADKAVTQCKFKKLWQTDPGNPDGRNGHYFAGTGECSRAQIPYRNPYYVFSVSQEIGANGQTACTLTSAPLPTTTPPDTPRLPNLWSIDQFVDSLKANRFSSIEEALWSLPESVRSGFTLVHDKHGLRGVSRQFPGAILFSDSGEYAITFGDESEALGNEMEIFRFNFNDNKGQLIRAAFPPERTATRTGRITVEENPAQCVKCHQSDPMMRFGTYGKWPGLFGSNEDTIGPKGSDADSLAFLSFMRARPTMPRYRALIPPIGETGILPYWDNSPVTPYTAISKDARMNLRPNARLNSVVAILDGRRLARRMMESPAYSKDRAQLLYEMLYCDNDYYSHFAPLLKELGIDQVELQPNKLAEPLSPFKLPQYSDGSSYNPNSVVDYAASAIYQDILKDYPELSGSYAESSEIDNLAPDWYFGVYPSSREAFTDFGNIGSVVNPSSDSAKSSFCTKLQNIARSAH